MIVAVNSTTPMRCSLKNGNILFSLWREQFLNIICMNCMLKGVKGLFYIPRETS
jgi:hypothetical protein